MAENYISEVELAGDGGDFGPDDRVTANVRFSIQGALRKAFNENNWTQAYGKFDNTFKLKYEIRVHTGGLKRRVLGGKVDTYRKASIFWTRNPKLVNPVKEKRIWVQVAKNFRPIIRLTEAEIQQELFDFDEKVVFRASELGSGRHKISADVSASWQKHDYTDSGSAKGRSKEIEIVIK